MTYFLLIIGFVFLIKGADYFVEGSSSLAKLLHVPPVIIGLTIVAMGTSAPETAVSITAGLKGNNALALANIVGSNIFNLLIVVGVCAAITPFKADLSIVKRDYPLSFLTSICLLFFVRDGWLSQLEGFLFLLLFVSYISYMIFTSLKQREESSPKETALSPTKSLLYIAFGLIGVIVGGNMVVESASKVALSFGLSQNLIGLTIVAIGTSLPELVTSVTAARKGESGLALGNVVGSNLFNILFILGASVGLNPIKVPSESIIDILLLSVVTLLIYAFIRKEALLTKTKGYISIGLYVAYTAYIILR